MSGIAQLNGNLFHGVLDARFPEMILWVSAAQIQGRNSDKNLENECHRAFTILSQPPSDDLSVLWVEQVLGLCSQEPATSLREIVNSITAQQLWAVVERRLLEMHTNAMLKMILGPRPMAIDVLGPNRPKSDYPFFEAVSFATWGSVLHGSL
jgi:hypothetical protein